MNPKQSLFAAAEAAWPEDEASLTFQSVRDRLHEAGSDASDAQWARDAFARDVAHMRKVFGFEPDASELVMRYDRELRRLLASCELTAGVALP